MHNPDRFGTFPNVRYHFLALSSSGLTLLASLALVLSYFPSIWEWLVFVLALAVMLLLYTFGERFLKLSQAQAL